MNARIYDRGFSSALAFSLCTSPVVALVQDPVTDLPSAPPIHLTLDPALRAALADEQDAEFLGHRQIRLPLTGRELVLLKIHDPETGKARRIALDQELRVVDYDALLALERLGQRQILGTMHPDLYRRILEGSESAPVEVMVKVNVHEEPIDKSELEHGTLSEFELRERSIASTQVVEQRAQDVLNASLALQGLAPVPFQRVDGPFVMLTLTGSEALALAHDENVAFIGPFGETRVADYPDISQSLPTTRTNYAHNRFSEGNGVRVAVLESGQTSIGQGFFRVADCQTSTGGMNPHMTMSLGMIGSTYNNGSSGGPWVGYAPRAAILMANDPDYTSAYSWAKDRGVGVVTMSWHFPSEETSGALHSRDVYFDYWTTHYPYPMVLTSAGNQAATNAYASGKGYNFFGVGNVLNDADGNRCDDVMSSSSSWKDPDSLIGEREVPEVAAPGSYHEVIGGVFGGTSCATPVAASIAACLIGTNQLLSIWPEAVRAIMLATANYQMADGQVFAPWRDGKDGTGMLDTWYGAHTANKRALPARVKNPLAVL